MTKSRKHIIILFFISLIIVLISSLIRLPSNLDTVNFTNSDATYHTLLTMQAYDENDFTIHKFLPIVTFGDETDKYIPWGATIPDNHGNYYYTSFSPAGYILPYLFCKITFLPISLNSLYIFNCLLYLISVFLMGILVYKIFKNTRYNRCLSIFSMIIYAFMPEVLRSMGIVYWSQSVMQVTLLLQLILFYDIYKPGRKRRGKKTIVFFLVLCLINPYIEWSGYVANMGYAFAFLFIYRKDIKKGITKAVTVLSLTFLSFLLFSLHYLTTVSLIDYLEALRSRFFVRNITDSMGFVELVKGYIYSFPLELLLIIILFIVLIVIYKGFSFIKNGTFYNNKIIYIVTLFPVLENIIMKQHAVEYTYDRMKFSFIIVLIICDELNLIFQKNKLSYCIAIPIVSCCLVVSCVFSSYYQLNYGIWDASYRTNNEILANYCTKKYDKENSVYGLNGLPVRGYVNLLYHRSIYEFCDLKSNIQFALDKNKRYAVNLIVSDPKNWNMYLFNKCIIYDTKLRKYNIVSIKNKKITEQLNLTYEEIL